MTVKLTEPTPEHIAYIGANLRAIDRLESEAFGGHEHWQQQIEQAALGKPRAAVALLDGEPFAVFGCNARTLISKEATPWMMATDKIENMAARRALLVHSKRYMAMLERRYDKLWNVVSEHNDKAIRLLKWLGFDFPGQSIEAGGHRFLYFIKEKS